MELASPQDPNLVALIGAYEEWPPLPGQEELGPMRVGSEGMLDFDGQSMLWSTVTRLYVTVDDWLDGSPMISLVAERAVGERTELETMVGTTAPAFEQRCQEIVERLQRFLVDNGVDRSKWPTIQLEARREAEASPGLSQKNAVETLARFEAICPHGEEPVLGRYVELTPDRAATARAVALFAGMVILGSLSGWWWTTPSGQTYRDLPVVAFLLIVPGLYLLFGTIRSAVRTARLRVGLGGFEVIPGCPPVAWDEVETFGVGEDIRIKLRSRRSSAPRLQDCADCAAVGAQPGRLDQQIG